MSCSRNRVTRFAGSLIACLVSGALAHAQHPSNNLKHPGFYDFQLKARSTVLDPFAQQAYNGQILEHTLWNHHYVELKDDLRASANYLLDRLARQSHGELLELHLQTARDLTYNRANYARYTKFRNDLDRKRVNAIVEYMTANHPDVTFIVRVIDPSPVGMAGVEAAKGYKEMSESSRGFLPPELQNYLNAILGQGSGGQQSSASPLTTPGSPTTPGGLGAEAVQGTGRPVTLPDTPSSPPSSPPQ